MFLLSDGLYGQPGSIHCIGMSVWTYTSQTDTISSPYDGV